MLKHCSEQGQILQNFQKLCFMLRSEFILLYRINLIFAKSSRMPNTFLTQHFCFQHYNQKSAHLQFIFKQFHFILETKTISAIFDSMLVVTGYKPVDHQQWKRMITAEISLSLLNKHTAITLYTPYIMRIVKTIVSRKVKEFENYFQGHIFYQVAIFLFHN